MTEIQLDIEQVKNNLEKVANLYNSGEKGYTRLAFSNEEDNAIAWVQKELELLGAEVRIDGVGNLFGRIGPSNVKAIAFGSHLDTVKNGGLFDGALGVFVGLECLRTLKENQFDKQTAYELICFKAEEGNPLGGTFGSRAASGKIDLNTIAINLLKSFNFSKDDIIKSEKSFPKYKAFLELHIEQGTVLENNHNKIGIVTNIAGISRNHITVKGSAGHSGTMPMHSRKDALVKASEIVTHVHEEAKRRGNGIVATIGQLQVNPNLPTVIPESVDFTFEVRGGKQDEIDFFEQEISTWIKDNYEVEVEKGVRKNANHLSAEIIQRLNDTAEDLDISVLNLVSGANHDANSLTTETEVGMVFVPSINGISHNPEESSDWKYIEQAAQIMFKTLMNFN